MSVIVIVFKLTVEKSMAWLNSISIGRLICQTEPPRTELLTTTNCEVLAPPLLPLLELLLPEQPAMEPTIREPAARAIRKRVFDDLERIGREGSGGVLRKRAGRG